MNTNRFKLMLAGIASGVAVSLASAKVAISRREHLNHLKMQKAVDEAAGLLAAELDRKAAQQDAALEALRLMIVHTDELLGRVLEELEAAHS